MWIYQHVAVLCYLLLLLIRHVVEANAGMDVGGSPIRLDSLAEDVERPVGQKSYDVDVPPVTSLSSSSLSSDDESTEIQSDIETHTTLNQVDIARKRPVKNQSMGVKLIEKLKKYKNILKPFSAEKKAIHTRALKKRHSSPEEYR